MRGHSKSLCTYFISEKDKTKLFTLEMAFISFNIQILISIVGFVSYYWRCDPEKQNFLLMRKIPCCATKWQKHIAKTAFILIKAARNDSRQWRSLQSWDERKYMIPQINVAIADIINLIVMTQGLERGVKWRMKAAITLILEIEDKKLKSSRMVNNCRYRNTSKPLKIANSYTNN